jgi:rare lipoprotein A (peptidoglycan hydrolase)
MRLINAIILAFACRGCVPCPATESINYAYLKKAELIDYCTVDYCTASWEQYDEAGQIGANGKPFDPNAMTCATRRWPLGARLRITDVHNGSSVIVTVTDRTPLKTKHAIDLSPKAFQCLNGLELGVCEVRVEQI